MPRPMADGPCHAHSLQLFAPEKIGARRLNWLAEKPLQLERGPATKRHEEV
jgi:hypothetical protein